MADRDIPAQGPMSKRRDNGSEEKNPSRESEAAGAVQAPKQECASTGSLPGQSESGTPTTDTLNPVTDDNHEFDEWWTKEGIFLDPDTNDVPWFDKRKELCAYAFYYGKKLGQAQALKAASRSDIWLHDQEKLVDAICEQVALFERGSRATLGHHVKRAIAPFLKREIGNRWIRKEDFRGEPNSSPLGWWAGRFDESEPYLDEILLDEEGRICGKGGCGADYYTHVMLAGIQRPKFQSNSIEDGSAS